MGIWPGAWPDPFFREWRENARSFDRGGVDRLLTDDRGQAAARRGDQLGVDGAVDLVADEPRRAVAEEDVDTAGWLLLG